MEWVNWSGSQRATPERFERPPRAPSSPARSSHGPGPVRVAGAGHSFSAGAVTDGTLLSLDALDRVLDADGTLVRVEAGIRLKALSRELHVRGLAMPNLGDIDAQSLAGALATGTHGTGTRLPNLSRPGRERSSSCSPTAASARSTAATSCSPPASRSGRSG